MLHAYLQNSSMSNEEIAMLWKKANRFARQRGLREESEDFAQYATMKIMNGRNAKFSWLLTDFRRQVHGQRLGDRSIVIAYQELLSNTDGYDPREQMDARVFFKRAGRALAGRDKIIFSMYYLWGKTHTEIAETLGLKHARVCQVLLNLNEALKQDRWPEKISSAKRPADSRPEVPHQTSYQEAAACLTGRDQTIFHMYYALKKSQQEIAEHFGIHQGAISQVLIRCLQKIERECRPGKIRRSHQPTKD